MSTPDNENKYKTDHSYDGIEEHDHAPPALFQAIFYGTITFAILYSIYFFLGNGASQSDEYRQAKQADEYSQYEYNLKNGGPKVLGEDSLKAMLNDSSKKSLGSTTYQAKCAACHGAQGQGGVGPNLVDDHWIHGGKLTQIVASITNGVPDKGMPPWGPLLKPEEIQGLTVFIRGLRGTQPAGAKAPQGELVKDL